MVGEGCRGGAGTSAPAAACRHAGLLVLVLLVPVPLLFVLVLLQVVLVILCLSRPWLRRGTCKLPLLRYRGHTLGQRRAPCP